MPRKPKENQKRISREEMLGEFAKDVLITRASEALRKVRKVEKDRKLIRYKGKDYGFKTTLEIMLPEGINTDEVVAKFERLTGQTSINHFYSKKNRHVSR